MQTPILKVNALNLLNNLRNAFADKTSFIDELLQNGRRSKASRIDIFVKEGEITFMDDGIGIDDFQKLLTVGETGWTDSDILKETPYGMGFLSAIFAADVLTVKSKAGTMTVHTDSFLKTGTDVDVDETAVSDKTAITIAKDKIDANAESHLVKAVQGLSVPVFLNGVEIKRLNAVNESYVDLPGTGKVKIALGTYGFSPFIIYLQGRVVSGSDHVTSIQRMGNTPTTPWNRGDCHIVHLDPTLFAGRMPERDTLVDHKENISLVTKAVNELHARMIMETLAEADDKEKTFSSLFKAIEALNMGKMVLDKLDFIPTELVYAMSELPDNRIHHTSEHRQKIGPLPRQTVESGQVIIVTMPPDPRGSGRQPDHRRLGLPGRERQGDRA